MKHIADHTSVAQVIMQAIGAEAEQTAHWLDVIKKIDESYQAELHQPLPHHQTSLVRLNYHANGGANDPDS